MAPSIVLAPGLDRHPISFRILRDAPRLRVSTRSFLAIRSHWARTCRRRRPGLSRSPYWRALAVTTTRIGLIATASTTYTEPFNLARQFASLDHISNGRVGWNIVTSWLPAAARNFGGAGSPAHEERYARGEEFLAVVNALWDSWAEDAVLDDRAGGRYARADRIRPINHKGRILRCCRAAQYAAGAAGPAGAGAGGLIRYRPALCRRHAEAVFTAHMEKSTAQAFYADLKALASAEGRNANQIHILPGLSPTIASTEAEARRLEQDANDIADPEIGRRRLSSRFGGHDFSHLASRPRAVTGRLSRS